MLVGPDSWIENSDMAFFEQTGLDNRIASKVVGTGLENATWVVG